MECETMKYGKALDFLLFSYFGCDCKADEETMKNSAAHRAYLDLARTVRFVYSSSYIDEHKNEESVKQFTKAKEGRIKDICESLIKSIDSYPDSSADFDDWHKKECTRIIEKMEKPYCCEKKLLKPNEKFTYGQAQKWMNMTLKYLWLLDLLPKEIKEESLHVPIDSFILQKLKENNVPVPGVTGSGEAYYYNGKTWSAMDRYEADYMKLQSKIREIAEESSLNPIQWEGPAWMEIARERSAK